MTRELTLILAAALSLPLLAPRPAAASGGVVIEMGTRKLAMGAVVGRPDEPDALYHNPAGLTLSTGTRLYVSAALSLPRFEFRLKPWAGSDRYVSQRVDADGYYPLEKPTRAFGVVPMLIASTSLWDDRLVLGLGLYVPNAVGAAFDEQSPLRYHVVESYVVTGAVTVAAALRLRPQLSLGLAVNLLHMRISARRHLFPVLRGLDLGGLLGGASQLEMKGAGTTASATVGVLWWPLPWISVGAALISRVEIPLEGEVVLTLGPDAAAKGRMEGIQRTDYVMPWIAQFGLNMDLTSWLEVGAEWRYYAFRQIDEQRTQIEGIDLLDELVVPRNYTDSFNIGGGALVRLPWVPKLELLFGAYYDVSPAMDNYVSVEQPSFDHAGLRCGARYRVGPRLRLAAAYVHYWYTKRDLTRSVATPAANFIGTGHNDMVAVVAEVCLTGCK